MLKNPNKEEISKENQDKFYKLIEKYNNLFKEDNEEHKEYNNIVTDSSTFDKMMILPRFIIRSFNDEEKKEAYITLYENEFYEFIQNNYTLFLEGIRLGLNEILGKESQPPTLIPKVAEKVYVAIKWIKCEFEIGEKIRLLIMESWSVKLWDKEFWPYTKILDLTWKEVINNKNTYSFQIWDWNYWFMWINVEWKYELVFVSWNKEIYNSEEEAKTALLELNGMFGPKK